MSLEDCNNTCEESKENESDIEKNVIEEFENNNVQGYFVLMDDDGKIYARYTFIEFMKLVNMRFVCEYPSKKNTSNNTKKQVNHNFNNTNNQAQKDSSFISILKLIIWVIITILCFTISLELFQLLERIV